MSAPHIPETAPFTPEQRAWLNGFLAGLFSHAPASANVSSAAPAARLLIPLTILFGSQTGTAEALAKRAAKEAGKRGFAAMVLDLAQTDPAKLAAEKAVLIICSTYGEGEPPDNAKALHMALQSPQAPQLPGLRFSICALGDRNYTHFCRCGQDFDVILEKLGATRVSTRVDCDLDYDEPFTKWLDSTLSALAAGTAGSPGESSTPALRSMFAEKTDDEAPTGYTRKNPFLAPVVAVRRLSSHGSAKEVNHVEFLLEGPGLTYEAGDALGVYPQNCPELVNAVLAALGCDGEEAVSGPDGEVPLRVALIKYHDLGKPPSELVELFAKSTVAAGATINGASLAERCLDVLDVLQAHPGRSPSPAEFIRVLRKLQPRLYSISSSPKAHLGHVHLTVGAVRYEANGRGRKGACSAFLAERAEVVGRVGVYVHANQAFKPPADGQRAMIMVGPGTGIAPFRAFLHDRRATGTTGKNWLFFGDQHAAHDFLYREELESFQRDGALHRLDTAFSRDQEKKVYVQDRMREQARDVFRWLEDGAHFYVCGDAARMAKDVDTALREIIQKEGQLSAESASAYVDRLRSEKRYARDVY